MAIVISYGNKGIKEECSCCGSSFMYFKHEVKKTLQGFARGGKSTYSYTIQCPACNSYIHVKEPT